MTSQATPDSALRRKKIGFIGAGNMGRAIIEGLLKANSCEPANLYISHPSAAHGRKFQSLNITNESSDNEQLVRECDVIVLCVKPQILEAVCRQISSLIDSKKHLVVSVCAGISLQKLANFLHSNNINLSDENKSNLRLARCMLNTAASIGSSCSVFSQNGLLSAEDKTVVEQLLSATGPCMGEIKDSNVDAAMAVCSCGIAYMYMMCDAMADGGVKMGLTRDMALRLSMQTMKGAGELMQKEYGHKHPMQLKDEVCSPGGTTIQGVHELERNGFRNAVICAVESAANRAKQF